MGVTFLHNTAQWYDTLAFVVLGCSVADAYFPGPDAGRRLLALFAIFAAGYALRPLGALTWPYVAARWGPRVAVGWAVGLSTFATAFIGCMPMHHQVRERGQCSV